MCASINPGQYNNTMNDVYVTLETESPSILTEFRRSHNDDLGQSWFFSFSSFCSIFIVAEFIVAEVQPFLDRCWSHTDFNGYHMWFFN